MITKNLALGILAHDDAQDLPIVNYTDSNSPYVGPWTYTGGTQNTGSQSPNNNVSLSTAYARLAGKNKSYKHLVKYLGPGNNDGQWGRGEWGWLKPGDQTLANAWYWHSISTLIDPAHAFESRRYQIAFDHKENPDDDETPFWLGIWGYPGDGLNGPRYGICGRYVGSDDPHGRNFIDLGPVVVGVWVDWALNRNWKTNNDGYMRFYKNGELVWSRLNQPNHQAQTSHGNNMAAIDRTQDGFYKWAWYTNGNEGPGSGNTTGDLIMYTSEIKFGNESATLASMSPGGAPPPDPNPGPDPIPTGTIRINSGGKKSGEYEADKDFKGGTAYSYLNTGLPEIYNTERFGNFGYSLKLSNGNYTVKLHFAECFFSAKGARIFDVILTNGAKKTTLLDNYDIFVKAGGKNKSVVESFPVTVESGAISIDFVTVVNNAKISAIEIIPASAPPPDVSMYVKAVALRDQVVDGATRKVSVTTFNDGTEQVITKKGN